MSSGQRAYFWMSRYYERLVVDISANSRCWMLACTHHVYNSVLTLSSPRAVLHLKKHSPMWILIFTYVFTKNPDGTSKEFCQCWRCKRCRFDAGWGRSPGGGHGNPLQYSCLENPTDGGFWWLTIHGVAKSQKQLKQLHISSVQFSPSVVSDSLRPHESQHAGPPCPSPTPGVHSDSRPSSQ